jgi:hypothetical protein
MKQFLLTPLMLLVCTFSFAQTEENIPEEKKTINALGQTVITVQATDFMKTPPVKDWPVVEVKELPLEQRKVVRKDFDRGSYIEASKSEANQQVLEDPLLQKEYGEKDMMGTIVNVIGMAGNSFPPDPTGAAGTNYYVQAVNTSFRIYNKTGTPVPGGAGGGPFNLSTLWAGSTNDGDPIVMYDRHADRWFISQIQFSPNKILIAISETNDPTGSYYAYSFNMSSFPDYPKYSVWWDGYYMTSNSSNTAVVFERDKMLTGDPTAQMVALSLPSLGNAGFRSPLSADADGALPPNGTPCYFFNLEDNAFSGVSADQIEIYEMTTDWVNTGNTSVSSSQILPVTAFDAIFTGGWANIAQPGTSQKLDAIMGVFMFRAQHMRWFGYNTIMLSHAVDLGSNRSGVRWYELRDADDGVWTVNQSGTYAPDNTSRWMSSVAMDEYGNIGMGYSLSDASGVFPGLAYTGRFFFDPPGLMTAGENIAISGSASQTITDRYGDYAHLALDPDGSTFWFTGEYIGVSGNPSTRIFSFKLANVGIEELSPYYDDLSMLVYQNDHNVMVKVDGIYNSELVDMDIIAMNGKAVKTQYDLKPNNGKLDEKINISKLQSGVYFIRVGNLNFQKVKRILIKN